MATDGRPSHLADRRAVAAAVAHQVRNPLAVLVGYAELLRMRADESTRTAAVDGIVAAAEALREVMENVLALFALEAGAVELDPVPVDLEEALDAAIAAVAERAPQHRITSERAGERPPFALGDREQLDLLLRNVLVGACACSSAKDEIRVVARRARGRAEVSLALPGSAVPRGELTSLLGHVAHFESPDAPVRATGLELYVAALLAETHGGSITVAEDDPVELRLTLPPAGTEAEAA